ncbi:hypothetical protein DL769_011254 [Monosporascus sp. CRB-8-3]|nr:hypothetical protein DL769_011254 [Monosporascus sp. CRB-8-3]
MALSNNAGSVESDPREFKQLSELDPRAGYGPSDAISTYPHNDDRLAASLAGLLPLTKWAHQNEAQEGLDAWNLTWQSAGTSSSRSRDGPLSTGSVGDTASSQSTSATRRARAKNSPEKNVTVPVAKTGSLMLPDTHLSEAQRRGPRHLGAAEKSRLVDAVCGILRRRIGGVLAAITRGAAGGEQSNPGSTFSPMRAVLSSQRRTNGAGKRKGTHRGEGPGDDSDADDLEKRHRRYPEPGPGVIRDKFACPCFKRDPQLYGPESDCASHSWDIRRLKEHLRRRHLPQFECDRCFGGFCSEAKLATHRRNCATSTKGDGDRPARLAQQKYGRIMDAQLFRGKSDHAKWLTIFRILYPEVPPEEYPSPYHDHNSIENFLHFALQQTSLHLPAELGQLVFVAGSEDARDRVTEVVRGFLRSVYDNYRDSQRVTPSTTLRAQDRLALERAGPFSNGLAQADPLPSALAAPETTVGPIAPGVQGCLEALLFSGLVDEDITRVLAGQTDPFPWDFEE